MIEFRQADVGDIGRIITVLASWEPPGGCGVGLQAGDLGWMLRFGPEHVASRVVEGVDASGTTRMILCMDSETEWWFALDPGSTQDAALAAAFAAWIERHAPPGTLSIDGPAAPAAWRQSLAVNGFEAGDERWATLWLPLAGRMSLPVEAVETTEDPANIADRVAVQRSAFERSTFTVARWHEMAAGSCFDPRFDLIARDASGNPVSAATFWFMGVGKCARLEPMGTHPGHRRQGHGLRLISAASSALAHAGASGICVTTPMTNVAAVGLYRAAGFRLLDVSFPMVREA